jgi:hypothetical protein
MQWPMARQWATVSVCVEYPDGRTLFRKWTGRTIRGIHRAARAHYAGARVSFGNGYYQQSFGAH